MALTKEESEQMRMLLTRFCREELDQHNAFKISWGSIPGYAYILIDSKPQIEGYDNFYTDITWTG